MKLNISTGIKTVPVKMGLYAPEGFGKSTFAAKAPGALVMDTENGTLRIDCRRVNVAGWEEAVNIVKAVIEDPGVCETLVIDTVDRLETYACDYLCAKHRKSSIEDWSYGKGYVALMELFQGFYKLLDTAVANGTNIILVAHARPRKFELPDQEGAFDRWELKLNRQTAPLLKEWVDVLLFGNYQTYVVTTDTNKKKAQGNKRVLYCSHMPTFDAKNRFGLPDMIDFSFDSVAHLFNTDTHTGSAAPGNQPAPPAAEPEPTVYERFQELLGETGYTEDEVRRVVADKGHFSVDTPVKDYGDKFITGWIFKYWTQIEQLIDAARKADN